MLFLPLASCFEDPDTAVTKQSDIFFQKPYHVIAGAFKVPCAAVVQRTLNKLLLYMCNVLVCMDIRVFFAEELETQLLLLSLCTSGNLFLFIAIRQKSRKFRHLQ